MLDSYVLVDALSSFSKAICYPPSPTSPGYKWHYNEQIFQNGQFFLQKTSPPTITGHIPKRFLYMCCIRGVLF